MHIPLITYSRQDLFSQKIARIPLKKYFPEYDGPEGDAAAAKKFILAVSFLFCFLFFALNYLLSHWDRMNL